MTTPTRHRPGLESAPVRGPLPGVYPGRRGARADLAAGRGSLGGIMMAPVCLTWPAATPMSRAPGPGPRSARLCSCRGLNWKVPSTCATWAACRPATAARALARLLRADNLQELSAADVTLLVRDLGLTTRHRLRSSAEVAAEGPAPLDDVPGVRHVHHPVMPELGSATDAVAEALLLRRDQAKSRVPARSHLRALPGLPGRPPGPGGRRGTQHRAGGGHGAGPLRGRQGPDRAWWWRWPSPAPASAPKPSFPTTPRLRSASRPSWPACAGHRRTRGTSTTVPADAHRARAETMQAFLREVDTRYGGARSGSPTTASVPPTWPRCGSGSGQALERTS